MTKDIDAIVKRNADYCKAYNNGMYTLDKWNERLNGPEIQAYFDVIRNM